jgi:excisionase family DNA binding protein
MNDYVLTIREVAELLKIYEETVYKLAAESKIPGFKVGGSWRFDRSTIAQSRAPRVNSRGRAVLALRAGGVAR